MNTNEQHIAASRPSWKTKRPESKSKPERNAARIPLYSVAALVPDAAELARFVDVLFRYANDVDYVAVRAFEEGRRDVRPSLNTWVRLGVRNRDTIIAHLAARAAKVGACFCPPVSVFRHGHRLPEGKWATAGERDVSGGVALTLDFDKAPEAGLKKAIGLIGRPTVIVKTGGEWTDPATGEIQAKVHAHWRTTEVARTPVEQADLRELRERVADLVGADMSGVPLSHCFRWAGSVHAKGIPKLARIVEVNDDAEIEVREMLERLRPISPAVTARREERAASSLEQQGEVADIAAALAIIPNGDLEWEAWNTILMAAHAASDGGAFDAAAAWSAKSIKHDADAFQDRWEHLDRHPATGIGAAKLMALAREVDPNWVKPSTRREREAIAAQHLDISGLLRRHGIAPPAHGASNAPQLHDAASHDDHSQGLRFFHERLGSEDVRAALAAIPVEVLRPDDVERIAGYAHAASGGVDLEALQAMCRRASISDPMEVEAIWRELDAHNPHVESADEAWYRLQDVVWEHQPDWKSPTALQRGAWAAEKLAEEQAKYPELIVTSRWRDFGAELIFDRQPKPKAPLSATPFAWVDPATIARRAWLYSTLLIRKELTATISPGGVGKTSLGIVEALSLASGKPLLGIKPPHPMKVWLINCEEPMDELQRRIMAAAAAYGLTADDIEGRLFVDSGHDQSFVVADTDGKKVMVRPVVDQMVRQIQERGIDVVFCDPFVSTHHVQENDNSALQQVVTAWKSVAYRGDAAIHLAHHSRKLDGREATADSSRGASALVDKARVVRALNPMSTDDAVAFNVLGHDRRAYFWCDPTGGKQNMSASTGGKEWFRLTSRDLRNAGPDAGNLDLGDSVGVVAKWEPPKVERVEIDEDKLTTLHSKLKNPMHRWKAAFQTKDQPEWVGVVIAEVFGIDQIKPGWKKEANKFYGRLKARGHVIEHRQGGANGNLFAFAPDDPEVVMLLANAGDEEG